MCSEDLILSELLDACGLGLQFSEDGGLPAEVIGRLVGKGEDLLRDLEAKQRELVTAQADTVVELPAAVERTEQALQDFQSDLKRIRGMLADGPAPSSSWAGGAAGLAEHIDTLRGRWARRREAVAHLSCLAQGSALVRTLNGHTEHRAVAEAVAALDDLRQWLGQARADALPGLQFAEAAMEVAEAALVGALVQGGGAHALFEELAGLEELLTAPESSSLHATLAHLERQYCAAAAAPVLDWARTLVLAPRWHADCRCEAPPFPACTLSKAAEALADRSLALLDRATTAKREATRQSLCQTALWLPQLYRMLLPTTHGSALQVAALSLQFQNDLLYMAFRLSRWRLSHTTEMEESVVVALQEEEQQLSSLAGTIFAECLRREQETLEDVVCAAGGFADVRDPPRYRKVHNAVSQVASQLQALRRTWQAVLPAPLLPHALGHILNAVMNAIVDELLRVPAIAAAEATQLVAILEPLLVCEQWFVDPRALQCGAPRGKGDFERQAVAAAKQHAPAFLKFKSLLDLLAATLTNVLAQWEAGQLPHFTAPELRALVAALFPDSAQRRAGLGKLDSG